ncbi:hypothetical protein IE53DRAFT_384707 [Violaceomyces palustris]|uniref:Uncharacterized protein n=1 Tax=Violaceomyces palustris TaxID=1673888 RepID=A0ACD0P431_9BASI|nr:hypothetical protein IE53DRAFT_384707 [Violaceomyces palustris]
MTLVPSSALKALRQLPSLTTSQGNLLSKASSTSVSTLASHSDPSFLSKSGLLQPNRQRNAHRSCSIHTIQAHQPCQQQQQPTSGAISLVADSFPTLDRIDTGPDSSSSRSVLEGYRYDLLTLHLSPASQDPKRAQAIIPALTVEDALSGLASWAFQLRLSEHQKLEITAEQLRSYLKQQNKSEEEWLRSRNALAAPSWTQARAYMEGSGESSWRGFVLRNCLFKISNMAEAEDALCVLEANHQRLRLRRFWHSFCILAEKALLEMPCLHLCGRMTDLAVWFMGREEVEENAAYRLGSHFAFLLIRHSDERARRAALRLYQGAKAKSATLAERINAILLQVNRWEPTCFLDKTRKVPAPAFKSRREGFLDADIASKLLEGWTGDRSIPLMAAIKAAARRGDLSLARQWFDELDDIRESKRRASSENDSASPSDGTLTKEEMEKELKKLAFYVKSLMLIKSEAASNEAWDAVQTYQDKAQSFSLEPESVGELSNWLAVAELAARDSRIPVDHVLSFLRIATSNDKVDKFPIQGLPSKFADLLVSSEKAHTRIMIGLSQRGDYRTVLGVWQAMLRRGIRPSVVCFNIYLQTLFEMRDARTAMEQVKTWTTDGVLLANEHVESKDFLTLPEILPTGEGTADSGEVEPSHGVDAEAAGVKVGRLTLRPNEITVAILFQGLYRNRSSNAVYDIWSALKETTGVIPGAPLLDILMKSALGSDRNALREGHQLTWDGNFSPYIAKKVFHQILMKQYPFLKRCKGPLEGYKHGWAMRGELGMRMVERWMGNLLFRTRKATTPSGRLVEIEGAADPSGTQQRLRSMGSSTTNGADAPSLEEVGGTEDLSNSINVCSKLFERYVRLILFMRDNPPPRKSIFPSEDEVATEFDLEELVMVLSWMKKLDLRPTKMTLSMICLEVYESTPPSAAAWGGGDESNFAGPLRGFLVDWLGESGLPTEREMKMAWKRKEKSIKNAERWRRKTSKPW